MHAILVGVGTSGDVNPVIGVGRALRARGHRVTMLANDHFAPAIEKAGLQFHSIGTVEEFRWAFSDPAVWHWAKYWRLVCERLIGPALLPTYQAIEAAYVPGESVAVGNHLAFGALLARDKLGVPTSSLIISTTMLRGIDQPPQIHPFFWRSGGSAITRSQYWWLDKLAADPPVRAQVGPLRRKLGLPPVKRLMHQWVLSADQVIALFPEWYMPFDRGWPRQTTLAGFPRVDLAEQGEIDESLARFLDAGPPPVAFTPGSAMNFGKRFFEESAKACRQLKCRGVFVSAYAGHVPSPLPEGIHYVPYVAYSQLFPRVRALVQHGGVGTSSIALAAGLPQLIVPTGHDQYQQGARVAHLKAGDWMWNWQYRGSYVAKKLARLTESPEVAGACREAAERIQRAPNALEVACREIEKLAPRPRISKAG